MYSSVRGETLYAYTGGKPFDPAKPTVVFIHGVLNDHSVWILQSRYFAHHGWNVLAIDLPGHGKSPGNCPKTVEAAAGVVCDLLDALKIERAALVGHSWGSLIALEAAARLGTRANHAALIGTAAPMKVSDVLLNNARDKPEVAIQMINTFSRATLAAPPSVLGPGTWVFGTSVALNRRVLRSNPRENVFDLGFQACNNYGGAQQAAATLRCKLLVLSGAVDQMTPAKAALPIVEAARGAGVDVRFETVPCGHHQMSEAPEETLAALKTFMR
jgi:pimeloyl-ACP methyl ester carboxylesterase